MHARLTPHAHRFSYSVFSLLIDLDALNDVKKKSAFFSVNQFNLMSFFEKDHGSRDGRPLAPYARDLFKKAGIDLDRGRVLLLCYPRILGYVFDPLSVYFGYDHEGILKAILYEVRNTFGEHHTYVAPVTAADISAAGVRQESPKRFFVSPFNPVAMTYRFRVKPPGAAVSVRILVTDETKPVLAASFHGDATRFSSATLLRLFLTIPFLTIKIIGGIHLEALRLWIKGMRIHDRPDPPAPSSIIGK